MSITMSLLPKQLNYIYTEWRKVYVFKFSKHYQIRMIPVACMISINKAANAILYIHGYLNIWGTKPNVIWASNEIWRAAPV